VTVADDYVIQRVGAEVALTMAGPPRLYTSLYDPVGTYPEFRAAGRPPWPLPIDDGEPQAEQPAGTHRIRPVAAG